MLTLAQQQTLKTAINADPVLAAMPNNTDSAPEIIAAFNVAASPAYWVWRTAVSRVEIYNATDSDGGTWNWQLYKAQSVTEQNAWVQMFMGDQANFTQANLRAGVSNIFSGSAQQNAQAAHVLAMGRRLATRGEKLYASGAGTTVAPSVMTLEGNFLTPQDVVDARNS